MQFRTVIAAAAAAALVAPASCRGLHVHTVSAGPGQETWSSSNNTSSSLAISLYETVHASSSINLHWNTTDNTSYYGTSAGGLIAHTESQESTIVPKIFNTYMSTISEHSDGFTTSADDTMGYINQVHSALGSLVHMLVPDRTTHCDFATVKETRTSQSNYSSTIFNSYRTTTKPALQTPVPVGQPQGMTQFDLIFLNATSPCYIALGRGNQSFIMVWEAPISERSTSSSSKALDEAETAKTWTTVFEYWAKALLFTVCGVYALLKAIMTAIDMCRQFRTWLAL